MTCRLRVLLLLIPIAIALAAGCNGITDGTEPGCPATPLPPVVSSAQVLRLDSLNLGEIDANGKVSTFVDPSIGYDLDGLCTTREKLHSAQCQQIPGGSAPVDGTNGIDNGFGKQLLPVIRVLFDHASATLTGFSYLALEPDGIGTLYLGKSQGIVFVIPLTTARLSEPAADGLVTLAAVIPREAFADSVQTHINLAVPEWCGTSNAQSLVETVRHAADLTLSGAPEPTLECDGVSLAIRFAGTPVATAPKVPRGCDALTPVPQRTVTPR